MVTERILATTPRFVCPGMDHLARIAIPELSILGRILKTRPFFLPKNFFFLFNSVMLLELSAIY
jgi:hypothetical protein